MIRDIVVSVVDLAALAASVMFIWCAGEAIVQRSDRGELPSARRCVEVVGKWIVIAVCIAVGVPLMIAVIVLCFVWPPLLALPVITLFVWAFCSEIAHPSRYAPAASNNDLLTGIVIGAVIVESYHHHD